MSESKPNVLRRSKSDRVFAGVCGGLGAFFGINALWFRIAFVIASLPGGLPGILPYFICWLVIPEDA